MSPGIAVIPSALMTRSAFRLTLLPISRMMPPSMKIELALRSGFFKSPVTIALMFLIRMEDMSGLYQRDLLTKSRVGKNKNWYQSLILLSNKNSVDAKTIARFKICLMENGPKTKPNCGSGSRRSEEHTSELQSPD